MRVMVTGGAGFIGAHVVDALVAAGHDVGVIDLRAPERNDVEHFAVDLADLDGLVRATRGADAVFHLAAVADVNDATAAPVDATDVNVTGTARVWEACRINEVPRAILASTVWVYSSAAGDGTVDEDATFTLDRTGHLYTSSKLAAEMVVRSYQTLYGQEFTILRYGIPYGPGMRDSLVIAKFVRMALDDTPITIEGDGSQYRNYVYVGDLAAAHVLALRDEAAGEVFNLDGRESVSIRQLVDAIGDAFGRPLTVEYRPSRAGDYAGREVSADKARRLLGWEPRVKFADGLRRYIDWHLSNRERAPEPVSAPAAPAAPTAQPARALAGLGLALALLPVLAVARDASLADRLFALAGSVTAMATAWLASRRARRFVPTVVTAVVLLTVVWLLSQTGPGAISVLLGLIIGVALGASPTAPAIHEPPTWRYAISSACALGVVAALARPALSWASTVLVLVACSSSVLARASGAFRDRKPSWTMTGAALVVTAITTSWIGATSPTAAWFGSVVAHGPRDSRQVALTIDGSSEPAETARVLQILSDYDARVTFFETPSDLSRPGLARTIAQDGHLLASGAKAHGESWLSPNYRDLPHLRAAFARGVGRCPSFFRPPLGRHTPFMALAARHQGMTMVTWDVQASDNSGTTPQQIATRLLDRIQPGSIVALELGVEHRSTDGRLVAALPYILDGLRSRGLQPVRLDALLKAKGYRGCPNHAAHHQST